MASKETLKRYRGELVALGANGAYRTSLAHA